MLLNGSDREQTLRALQVKEGCGHDGFDRINEQALSDNIHQQDGNESMLMQDHQQSMPSMFQATTPSFPLVIYQEGCISVGQVLKLDTSYKVGITEGVG